MRIAWVTPLVKHAAIGRFSLLVTRELAKLGHEIRIIRCEARFEPEAPVLAIDLPVTHVRQIDPAKLGQEVDLTIINFGNNFALHAGALDMLAAQPCLGIFHDFCLIGLLDGWANATGATGDDYEAQIIATYGEGARETARQAREGSLSLPAIANRMPMTEWLAAKCAGAMAHAEFYLPRLRRACAGPVAVAPLAYALEHPSPASERRDGRLILATFGDIVANKCAAEIIAAIASAPSLRERLEYHLIGAIAADERARLQDLADAAGFTGLRIHGRVEEEAFLRHLA
ncbi:MAG TPA: glycosyl transferase family 1, partial [Caulobacteraceae bacterium]|nr:glycosyl transferase family 1 [Caulobacteraceae bacterium]